MWVALISLLALGVITATSAAVSLSLGGDTGWTFYTPSSVSTSAPPLANWLGICVLAQRLLLPLAAIASAVYLYLAERDLRGLLLSRGFPVQAGRQSGGT
jgi:heme/copper-type cytochrome/quinol oxidase subunit 1